MKNLSAQPTDLVMMQGVAVCGGSDFAADRLIDPNFIEAVQQRIGAVDLYVCAPHRRAIYAIATNATDDTKALFSGMVSTELTRTPPPGAPVSDLVFRVVDGRLTSAHRLDEVVAVRSAPTQSSSDDYGLSARYMGSNYGLPRPGSAPIAGDETEEPRAARAAGIAAMVMLVLSALSGLAATFLDYGLGGTLSAGGFAFWIACAFLIRLPKARTPAIVALVASFVGLGATGFFLHDAGWASIGLSAALDTVTWSAFAWALGKACSPPKIGAGVTGAVAFLSLLWIPVIQFAWQLTMVVIWLRLIVLMGLAGYVIKENS